VEQRLDMTERNLFLDTAIELLPLYERDLGITIDSNLNYVQRRELISSRIRAVFDQTTEETIKNVASAYGNGEIDIYPSDTPGVYKIEFSGIGVPNNIDGFTKTIDSIIPAHIEIEYVFQFNTWKQLQPYKWADTEGMTWDELREWDEVTMYETY